MSLVIAIDSGVLSILTTREGHAVGEVCRLWAKRHLSVGTQFIVPEIADYELRRELIRAKKTSSVLRLDALNKTFGYLPVTTAAVRYAAQLWAQSRNQGLPTSSHDALDGDVLICAQVLTADWQNATPVVATTNPAHLSRFITASLWQDIPIPTA